MSKLTRDGTAELVSRDQILRRERGQGNMYFPCSADHVQDWQPYPVDTYSCYMCDHIHTLKDAVKKKKKKCCPVLVRVRSCKKRCSILYRKGILYNRNAVRRVRQYRRESAQFSSVVRTNIIAVIHTWYSSNDVLGTCANWSLKVWYHQNQSIHFRRSSGDRWAAVQPLQSPDIIHELLKRERAKVVNSAEHVKNRDTST